MSSLFCKPVWAGGLMNEMLSALQWPAMVTTLAAAWLVASGVKSKRRWGFWCFIASNTIWIVWGWCDGAHALIVMQLGLFAMNVRGARRNQSKDYHEKG